MGTSYHQLSLKERCTIAGLHETGHSIRQIAAAMDRTPSTVARELKRNTNQTQGYAPEYAHLHTASRRWRGSRLERQLSGLTEANLAFRANVLTVAVT